MAREPKRNQFLREGECQLICKERIVPGQIRAVRDFLFHFSDAGTRPCGRNGRSILSEWAVLKVRSFSLSPGGQKIRRDRFICSEGVRGNEYALYPAMVRKRHERIFL